MPKKKRGRPKMLANNNLCTRHKRGVDPQTRPFFVEGCVMCEKKAQSNPELRKVRGEKRQDAWKRRISIEHFNKKPRN